MYIAADSDFVANAVEECPGCTMPHDELAAATIQVVFCAVQEVYRRDACVNLRLTGYDIRTNPNSDPYRDTRLASVGVCDDNNSHLQKLASWLGTTGNDPSNGDRTTFHLFYGDPNASGYRTIGCAWMRTLCSQTHAAGVNEMSWSSSLTLKRNLLAHENGHNYAVSGR